MAVVMAMCWRWKVIAEKSGMLRLRQPLFVVYSHLFHIFCLFMLLFLTHVVVLFVCYLFSLFLFHINFSIVIVNSRQIESDHRQLGRSRLVRPPTATEDGSIPLCFCCCCFHVFVGVCFVVNRGGNRIWPQAIGRSRLVRPPTATEDGPISTCVFLFRCFIAVLFVIWYSGRCVAVFMSVFVFVVDRWE